MNYFSLHNWLNEKFGKATRCEFCDTKVAKRYEYCLKKGMIHEKKRENYIQLCTGCHRKYDWTKEKSLKWSSTTKQRWIDGKMRARRGFKLSLKHIESIRKSKLGDNNPAKRLDVRKKISETVKRLHREGIYKK